MRSNLGKRRSPNGQFILASRLSALLLPVVLTGCIQTRTAVREQEEKQVLQKTVKTLQQSTADVNTRFTDIEDDMRKLNGRVEAAEYKLVQIQSNEAKGQQASDQKAKEVSDRMVVLQEAVTKLDSQVAELSSALVAMREELKRAPVSAPGGSGSGGPYAAAEELFKKSSWKEAILEYEKYRKSNPKGKQFADATYKIGVCFQELGLADEARAFYEEVIAKFPKSKDADKAGYRLRNLKKK